MATGEAVPGEHHLARYCKNSQVDGGEVTGAAFQLEGTHKELSTTCIEYLTDAPTRAQQLRAVAAALNASGLTTKQNGWLAVLRANQITSLTELAGSALQLSVLHDPVPGNEAHSIITGLHPQGSPLATAIGLELSRRVCEPAVQLRNLQVG